MNRVMRRRAVLGVGLSMGLWTIAPAARACEFFTTNLRIIKPWARATAVGDAHAVVCMSFDDVAEDDRLIGVETPLARGAEMGGIGAGPRVDFAIPRGRLTVLDETTTYVRLIGLRQPLELGREYPLRLVFERGGAVDADLDIDYARLT